MKKLYLFISITLLMLFMPVYAQAQNNDRIIEIWGNVTNTDRCKVSKKTCYGLYKIVIKNGSATFKPLATGDKRFAGTGGGVISDSHCTYVNTKGSRSAIRSFNTVNWKEEGASGEDVSEQDITASAAAYEESTGKVYGCISFDKGKAFNYGYIDYENMRSTKIGYNDEQYVSMALDGSGILYGVNTKGELHRIDKRSGDNTIIGSTNVNPKPEPQGMAYNTDNGKMYWAASPLKGSPVLYEIDVTNGTVKEVCRFTDNDEISFMYIPRQPEASSPARLYDMEVNFEGALNKGNITFTMPDEYYGGAPLNGSIEYDIMINDKLSGSSSAAAGAKVNETVMCSEAGMYNFQIILKKDGKQNPYNHMSRWVGYDEPSPIRNLKYYSDMNRMVYLRWKEPLGGKHGGYIDRSNLVYKIVRNPGGLVVAEECTETHFEDDTSSGNSNSFYYEVTPYIKEKK